MKCLNINQDQSETVCFIFSTIISAASLTWMDRYGRGGEFRMTFFTVDSEVFLFLVKFFTRPDEKANLDRMKRTSDGECE